MTDGWSEGSAEPPRRPRVWVLAGVAGAVVLLAAVGATGGWLLAGSTGKDAGAGAAGRSASPSPSPSLPRSTSRAPSSSSSPSPAPASAAPGRSGSTKPGAAQFPLPDVTGDDFADARRRLRDLKLGVQVVFGGAGEDRSVNRTEPSPGASVHAGITVKLYVLGAPPSLEVPSLVGMGCAAAGREAADRGFDPRYVPRKAGTVARQDPQPYARAHWNDPVTLYCVPEATASSSY
jgi:hypothetical protein